MCACTQQASPWTQATALKLRGDRSVLSTPGKLSDRVTVVPPGTPLFFFVLGAHEIGEVQDTLLDPFPVSSGSNHF